MNFESFKKLIWVPAFVVAGGIFLGLWVHGVYMASRTSDMITVTGSAKRAVVADLAKWTATFTRRSGVFNVKQEFAQAVKDGETVKKFVIGLGVPATAIRVLPIQTEPLFDYNQGSQSLVGYAVRQEIRVESTDLAKVELLAKSSAELVELGIIPEFQRTDYLYTKIAELRPELFAEATKDAKLRAEAIAGGTGARVGALKTARTGVVQVLSPNSLDVSDYGTYDLSTKEKEVTATVNVSFQLR